MQTWEAGDCEAFFFTFKIGEAGVSAVQRRILKNHWGFCIFRTLDRRFANALSVQL